MQFDNLYFGSIQIAGSTYEHDIVIDRGKISKRKKKASKRCLEEFGHTQSSIEELSVGTLNSRRDQAAFFSLFTLAHLAR